MSYILFGDIVEANGKTIRENNAAIPHNIPIGTLVEVKYSECHAGGACEKIHARLFVVGHARDCDGSPLYTLAPARVEEHLVTTNRLIGSALNRLRGGFSESQLKIIHPTPELLKGYGALEWSDDER